MARPPLELVWTRYASANQSPFDALLVAAEEDAEAAEGLALAYAALDHDARSALFTSVVRDAEDAGRSPAGPLALLLAVEEDRALAERIARALSDASPPPGRARGAGWTWGSSEEGGIALASEGAAAIALFGVTWEGARLRALRAGPVAKGQLEEGRRRLGVPESAETIPLDAAIDRLASQLWRARRASGPLPEDLRALAGLFAPYR